MNLNRRSAIMSAISGCLAGLLPWKPKQSNQTMVGAFVSCHFEYLNGVKHYFAASRCGTRLELKNESQYRLLHRHLSSGIAGKPYWWSDALGAEGVGLLKEDGYAT